MKYKLYKDDNNIDKRINNPIDIILQHRGIPENEVEHYLNTTDDDINSPILLGAEYLENFYDNLKRMYDNNENFLVVVDSDADGYCSSAILINYLTDMFSSEWVEEHMSVFFHAGKQHGLQDVVNLKLINSKDDEDKYNGHLKDIKNIFVMDAGTNDLEEFFFLDARGITVFIGDHHELEISRNDIPKNVILINNQDPEIPYPNKYMCGAGVTWQICRYIDMKENTRFAENYYDLVALALCGDMMSLRSIETKHLMQKGFKTENIVNPFIFYLKDKNSYYLQGDLTPHGAAFSIVPYINATVRSGTFEEKELIFNSMLKARAFNEIPSTKRGHKPGDMERLVVEAVRIVTNVKSKQKKMQDDGLAIVEQYLSGNEEWFENKVWLFLLENNSINKNILGLIANKIMPKFQRNVALLSKGKNEQGEIVWRGSARGYNKNDAQFSFKQLCQDTGCIEFAQGHAGAFGLGIADKDLEEFFEKTNKALEGVSTDPAHYVDFVLPANNINLNPNFIADIARFENLWGQDIEKPYIMITDLIVEPNMVTLMSPDKHPTIKIRLNNQNIEFIKRNSSQEEYENFIGNGTNDAIKINVLVTCNLNEWNGNITPQLIIEDYEISENIPFIF